ncbi:NlpC/P60 family protein [Lacticaseibacillus hulanensis]|uniref:C40 family peptidase n=1 Tax=Lacticaseibacillus hulanensis TaxID=2493111 RepID=UPI0013E2DEBC|nr:C40 family peptidase [Lacticaseibacillus hulanensis]
MKSTKLLFAAIASLSFATVSLTNVSPVAAATKSEITQENQSILSKIEAEDKKNGELADKVSAKNDAINAADKKIDSSKAKIASLSDQIVKEQKEVKARTTAMKKQLVSLQKEAGDSVTGNVYVDFVLNCKNLTDLISRGTTVSKLNSANQDALQQVKDAKNKLADLKADQKATEQTLEDTRTKLVSDKTKLVSLQKDAKAASAKLNKMLEDNKDVLAEISAKEAKQAAAAAKKAAATASKKADTKIAEVAAAPGKAANANASSSAAPATSATLTKTSSSKKSASSSSSSSSASSSSSSSNSSYSASYGSAIAAAESQMGKPYVWGGAGPSSFDCSGLTMWAFAKIGVSLPHSAALQSQMGTRVSVSSLQPGDLVFWGSPAHHVGIYIGGGQFIHAPHTGDVVKITSISGYRPDYGVRL